MLPKSVPCAALPVSCLIPTKLVLAEIQEVEQEEVRREETQHGLTDIVVELFISPNLNKNGTGFLRVPGLGSS